MLCKYSKCSIEVIYWSGSFDKQDKFASDNCNENIIIKGTPGIKPNGSECFCECHKIGISVRHIMPCCDKTGIKYMKENK